MSIATTGLREVADRLIAALWRCDPVRDMLGADDITRPRKSGLTCFGLTILMFWV
jgi:hypothetical protein